MNAEIEARENLSTQWERTSGLIPFAMIAIGMPWAIWSAYSLVVTAGSPAVSFAVAAGWFVILAFGYLGLHGVSGMAWASIPAMMTIQSLVTFIVVPIWLFATGDLVPQLGDAHAMFLVLVGFVPFWVGSLLFKKESQLRFTPRNLDIPDRIVFVSTMFFVIGLGANLFLWRQGLFGLAGGADVGGAAGGYLQPLESLADLLTAALAASAIELFGKPVTNRLIGIVFWLSLSCSILLGVVSGMKARVLTPMLYAIVVYGITRRRLPKLTFALPIILVVLVYPFVTAYRSTLNEGYRDQANTLDGMEATLAKSFNDAFFDFGSTRADTEKANLDEALYRLDYLNMVRTMIELPAPSMLPGDEKPWLAPVYALVPRFAWKDKPVFDEGIRLNYLLTGNYNSSAAPTLPGDLFVRYGIYGVIVGMFVFGACIQLLMNWVSGQMSEMLLFIYISMLMQFAAFIGADVTGGITGLIHYCLIIVIVAYVIYQRPKRSAAAAKPFG